MSSAQHPITLACHTSGVVAEFVLLSLILFLIPETETGSFAKHTQWTASYNGDTSLDKREVEG